MSDVKQLGQLVVDASAQRDAIHVAIAPAVAGESLAPGDHVGFLEDGRVARSVKHLLGIVDPFLKSRVLADERFWLVLYPQTITSLRHDWTHPAFVTSAANTQESERWLRNFAVEWNFDYGELIDNASAPTTKDYEQFIVADGIDLHSKSELGEDYFHFWRHLELVTGKSFDEGHRERFGWSCSC